MILLDTHVVVWLAAEPTRLSAKAHGAIQEARASGAGLAVCDITMLEIAMLARRRKLEARGSLESVLDEIESTFRVLAITAKASARAAALTAPYPNDPADRIIGATALVEGLPLVTADRAIRESGVVPTIW